ncbi:MAG: Mrp/NBP35 family ATP-binding protein [Bacilli bacterium]|nr:Mrp/NBP35 family ATP-binding protein [Bacilli bacterium]
MADCNHQCEGCSVENCSERTIEKLKPHPYSNIKKIYAIISGKGGVGKSLVTSLLASSVNKKGKSVAVIDADVTGPSVPQAFGLKDQLAESDESGLYPVLSKHGVKVMSANLLLEDKEAPIVWRGPIVSSFVQQLFTDVIYGDVDYMFIDMPPGTGDIPLTVFQMIPIDGIIVVSSPQELVSMVVAKSINMANMMNIPIVGMVENMAYIKCPDCGKKITVFGDGHFEDDVKRHGLKLLAEIPIDPELASKVDKGEIEEYQTSIMDQLVDTLFTR